MRSLDFISYEVVTAQIDAVSVFDIDNKVNFFTECANVQDEFNTHAFFSFQNTSKSLQIDLKSIQIVLKSFKLAWETVQFDLKSGQLQAETVHMILSVSVQVRRRLECVHDGSNWRASCCGHETRVDW